MEVLWLDKLNRANQNFLCGIKNGDVVFLCHWKKNVMDEINAAKQIIVNQYTEKKKQQTEIG